MLARCFLHVPKELEVTEKSETTNPSSYNPCLSLSVNTQKRYVVALIQSGMPYKISAETCLACTDRLLSLLQVQKKY